MALALAVFWPIGLIAWLTVCVVFIRRATKRRKGSDVFPRRT